MSLPTVSPVYVIPFFVGLILQFGAGCVGYWLAASNTSFSSVAAFCLGASIIASAGLIYMTVNVAVHELTHRAESKVDGFLSGAKESVKSELEIKVASEIDKRIKSYQDALNTHAESTEAVFSSTTAALVRNRNNLDVVILALEDAGWKRELDGSGELKKMVRD